MFHFAEAMIEAGEENTYDFMFIDADKTTYGKYFELGLRLVRSKGIIAIDNVSNKMRNTDPAYISKCHNHQTLKHHQTCP